MSLRFITGTSGQGKSRYIIDEVIDRSLHNPDRQYYVIVPEQFSLEMQRSIAEHHPDHGYMNIDVLSFYRMAYRVFDEVGFKPCDLLEDLGVSMILRKILAEHEEEFPYFKRNRRQAGFLDELKSVLMEFICYGISCDQLTQMEDTLSDYPQLARKCRELGRIYDYFEKTIEGRYMVTEQILDVLCDFVDKSKLLQKAVFYFDGFTGFTPVQLNFLEELLPTAAELNVSVTIPGEPETLFSAGGEDLFHFSEKTIRALQRICKNSGQSITEPVCLQAEIPPRYGDNEELAWLERYFLRRSRRAYAGQPEHIHMTSCPNPEQEAEWCLHKLLQLVRNTGCRYRDCAILTGDLAEYSSAFERQAQILGIPLFTDTKKRMSYHPAIETLRSLFHLVSGHYSYESVFRYLKSGMTGMPGEEIDFLENYVIRAGIRGYSMWKQPFVRRMNRYDEEDQNRLNRLREQVLDETEAFYLIWKDPGASVKNRMAGLYEFMCHLDYPGKLEAMADRAEEAGDYVREKEYREIFGLLLNLLDKIADIFADELIPARELSDLMDAGFETLGLGVLPLSADQVILGDLKRTRLSDIKSLFIVGLNEGLIPRSVDGGGILSDEEKKILLDMGMELSYGREEQAMEDEFYMYLAFARPGRDLYFSWSQTGRDGKSRLPSPVIKEITGIFPGLSVRHYPEEEKRKYYNTRDSREFMFRTLMQLGREDGGADKLTRAQKLLLRYWKDRSSLHEDLEKVFKLRKQQLDPGRLSKTMAAELFGREIRGSVTRMERYASCPYQYFCLYGLGLAEREEYGIYPVDLGNLFHRALQHFSLLVKESEFGWKTLPEEETQRYIERSLEEIANDDAYEAFFSSARDQYKLNTVKRILERSIRVLKIHLADSDLEPDRFELHFGKDDKLKACELSLSEDRRMVLEGYIDRVDIYEDENGLLMRIIDYKSGSKRFDMDDLCHGLELQLVIYMRAARELYQKEQKKPVTPAGMYYYQLQDPIAAAERFDLKQILKEFRMSGYTNASPEILDKLERGKDSLVSASVRKTKEGLPMKNSPVLTTEEFDLLERYVYHELKTMGEQIYQGRIKAYPYRKDGRSACDYCIYNSVCGFEQKEGHKYNSWKKQRAKEALESIRKQVD